MEQTAATKAADTSELGLRLGDTAHLLSYLNNAPGMSSTPAFRYSTAMA